MEESGENWPSDSDLEKCDDDIFKDGESESVCDEMKLKEKFLALSVAIGSKKKDDISILDKATNYVKQLQMRLKELEQDAGSSNVSSNICGTSTTLLDVKAKVLQKEVFLRIHCERHKNVIIKILTHLESLHLSVVSSNVLQFGKSTLDITIVAQMGDECKITMDELVKTLRIELS